MAGRRPPAGSVLPVTIGTPLLWHLDAHTVAEAAIDRGEDSYPAWYRVSNGPVASGAEPFLAGALPVAMALGRPLRVDGPVSAQLLTNLHSIQAIYRSWNPGWRVIPVSAQPTRLDAAPGNGAACFFSGGVDSFYTLLEHLDEIDALVFIHGFDIPLGSMSLRATVSAALREVARMFGKSLIEVETNLKEWLIRDTRWEYSHGALLAGVALLLSPQFSRIYIAASDSYGTAAMVPWGSHPLLDPLWSTERTTVVHDGADSTRLDKVAAIAGSDVALRWLRVCWENPNGEYNCGRCAKCLRTMVSLRILGALERCRAFDRPLDLAAVARMPISSDRSYLIQNFEAAEHDGTDPELVRALRDCVSERFHRGLWPVARRLRGWARRVVTLAVRGLPRATPPGGTYGTHS